MADNKDKWVRTVGTSNGLGGVSQDLNTGLSHDAEGNVVTVDVPKEKPNGATIVQVDQIGVYERTIYSDGSTANVQVRPIEQGNGEIQTPVPLPGEKQDVAGTGQDEAFKPKMAPGAKTGKAVEK